MKPYKIVKRSTYLLIAISTFVVVLSVTLFGLGSIGVTDIFNSVGADTVESTPDSSTKTLALIRYPDDPTPPATDPGSTPPEEVTLPDPGMAIVADSGKLGDTIKIDYAINNAMADYSYELYVSTNCTEKDKIECWSRKTHGSLSEDSFASSYEWNTTGATVGEHIIKLKLYDQNNAPVSKEEISVYVTDADGNGPGEGGTPAPPPATKPDVKIETPDTIKVKNPFSAGGALESAFIMPQTIKGAGDVITIIIKVLELLIGFFAFLGLVVSGVQYISSGGDPAKAEKAKKTMIYCLIGILIAIFALAIQGIIARFW